MKDSWIVFLLVLVFVRPDFIKASPLSLTKESKSDPLVVEKGKGGSRPAAAPNAKPSTPALDEKDELNSRPIIGILAQELSRSLSEAYQAYNYTSYIGAAYVKYVESAGARVVPVLINQDDEYYEMIFNSTNGLLIPGGAVSLTESGYARAGKKLYELALQSWDNLKDPYPIWGTCLGFELLALFTNDDQPNLSACWSQDQPLALNLTGEWDESDIGQAMPKDTVDILETQEVTINFHRWCLTPQNFSLFHMDNFWRLLATGKDVEDLEFIAFLEAKNYPIWGTQFHPEKNAYEWTLKYPGIPHSKDAISSANWFAEYFVEKARKNKHKFDSMEMEQANLIYNYSPLYTGKEEIDFVMQQCYMF